MKLRTGNMFDHMDEYGIVFVTANSTIKSNGELVMGTGAARVVRDRYPGVACSFGKRVRKEANGGLYGILLDMNTVGLFQTKIDYRENSKIEVITYSIGMLVGMIGVSESIGLDHLRYAVNFPGIGNGGLHPSIVMPYLRTLPDSVDIWSFPGELEKIYAN